MFKNTIICTVLFSAFIFPKTYAQNIVANYSFENHTSCPSSNGQVSSVIGWYNPTNASPDFFDSCSTNMQLIVPDNIMGYQYAKTGHGYVGIVAYYPVSTREYISSKLIDSLKAGHEYCVSFYVSLADTFNQAFGAFGVYFSKDSVKDKSTSKNLPYTPQFENSATSYVSDKTGWTEIRGSYVAQGGEYFITIGNFNDDTNTSILNVGGTYTSCYYYIDDVSITDCTVGIYEKILNEKVKINYNNNTLTINSEEVFTEKCVLDVFDVSGRKVFENILLAIEKGSTQIHVAILPSGIFTYRLQVKDGEPTTGKFIVLK